MQRPRGFERIVDIGRDSFSTSTRVLAMNLVFPLLFASLLAIQEKKPPEKFGEIDYEAKLNDILAKGITPENNANVLIWKALGPTPEGGKGMPAEYFKRLGIKEPPKEEGYFLKHEHYARERLKKINQEELSSLKDDVTDATRRVWTAKQYPHVAGWLNTNESALAVVIDATKRPSYFNPLVPFHERDRPGLLINARLPSVQSCRELALALAARALFRVGEGKFDSAWEDLIACHRLGRLVGRGALLVEGLIGYAIQSIATNATLAYLERSPLTSKQLLEHLKEFDSLPPTPPPAAKVELGERLSCLDSIQ
ncbi:MAG TPA: hypothetical protein VLM40_22165, partial [Gemmata sp.]|nr:hypothetical protein [Gemmata sp.]